MGNILPSHEPSPIELPEIGAFINPVTVFVGGILVPGNMGAAPCELSAVPCGMMSSEHPGFWDGKAGAAEWGKRHGVGAKEGIDRLHKAIKQHTPGARGDHDLKTNPDTGEVIDQNGDEVGNLNDEDNQGSGHG